MTSLAEIRARVNAAITETGSYPYTPTGEFTARPCVSSADMVLLLDIAEKARAFEKHFRSSLSSDGYTLAAAPDSPTARDQQALRNALAQLEEA